MRNLFDIDKIQQIPKNQTIQNHHSFVFLSGVVKYNRCFDMSGDLIDGRVIATPNFSAELVSFSEATEELEINWTNDAFDYYGVVALKNELMFINTTGDDGIAPIRTSTGTLKIKINQRCLFGTFKQEHSAGEVLRSVVNITEGTVSYKAENKTNISSNMFAPAVATGSISIFDDVRRWIYYNDNGIFDVKVKTPIYIYSGLDGKTILDYLGFITNCDISFNEQSIEIDFANKLSIYWDEDLNMNKVFTDITIKSVLSQVLGLNEGAIKYPRYFDANGNELIEYTDDDFFTVDVIATKEFETYQAFLTTLCNEMMCRITFNGDDLVIQSEVMKTKNNTNNIKNAILVTEYDNIISMTDKTSDDAIFNKIESTFLVRTPYYNEDFKWTTKEYPNEAAFLADSANYGTFDIATILDTKEYFKKEVVNTGYTYIKQFVNKGTISDYHLEEGFSKPIKYEFESSNVKCDNGKGLIYQNDNGDWYFNTVTVVVGANASYLNIGEPYQYVMLTDGRKDFTGVPVDMYIDEFDSSKNTATFIFGFDRDSNNYERGYVDYTLIPMGYDNVDKTYHLYYGRLDMLYSYEYNVDNVTYCIKKPLIAGETVTLAATFGGVDTPDGKFSGVVAWLNDIYDTVFTKDELLYNREYHQEIPVYVKSNTLKKNTTNNYLDYATFENDKLALQVKKTNTIVKETLSFDVTDVSSYNTFDDTSADMFAKFTNTTFGFKIKFLSTITVGSTTLPMVNDLSSDGSYTALDFTYDEIKNPTGDTNIAQYYKVEYNGNIYFVDKDYTERFYSIADDNFISRANIISVDASSILVDFPSSKFQIGDLIKLAKSNEDNYNCSFNYARYSDNDFFVVWFEDEYYSNGTRAGLRIYFDYEMPVGLLNTFMELEHHKAEDILVLQEFAIRGNPYYDKEIPINYENEESIDRYGEKKYDSFTGKMMKLSDLKTAVNYLVNGFSATSKETTKKIFTIKSDLMFDLDVLDFIMIDERIYTGMTHDSSKAVIISKSIDNSNGQLTNTFTCMTVGAFEFKNTSLTKTITTTYEPETLPVYSHSASATGTSTNVLDVIDVVVSLFDDYLGSVSLIKVADGNLVVNTLERYDANSTIMSFGNFSPLYTSDTTGMTDEQIYNAQVANQKLETYASNIFQVDKEGFVLIGTEYIYFTTKSLTKIADPISSDVTDKITTSVTVEIKQRGCFETVKSTNIPTNTTATVFSIASITNADGIYTLATTMGNIASRDYLSFSIEDGLAIETDRGKLLINTEDEYLQNIADKFGVIGIDLDSLGKGLVQIGNSTSMNYIRYTPLYGIEFAGNADIRSGSIKMNINKNNITTAENFINLNKDVSQLGFNVQTGMTIPSNLISLFQVGAESSDSFFLYKATDLTSSLKMKADYLYLESGQNKILFDKETSTGRISLLTTGYFQLGSLDDKNHILFDLVNDDTRISSANIYIESDENNYISMSPTSSKFYFNDGAEQIGSEIIDSANPTGFNGMYFGATTNGVADLSLGQYIKYDVNTARLSIGQKTALYQGENPLIAIDSLIANTLSTLTTGSTTMNEDLIKIYGAGKYRRLTLHSANTTPIYYKNATGSTSNTINIGSTGDLFYGTSTKILSTMLLNLMIDPYVNGFLVNLNNTKLVNFNIKLVNTSDSTDVYELLINSTSATGITCSGFLPTSTTATYLVYLEKVMSAKVLIGNLNLIEAVAPKIQLGWKTQTINSNTVENVILSIVGDATVQDFFTFQSQVGLSMKTTKEVSIIAGNNAIYMNGNSATNSYIRFNSNKQQIGALTGLSSLFIADGTLGLFVGDKTSDYLYFTDKLKVSSSDVVLGSASDRLTLNMENSSLYMNNGSEQIGKLEGLYDTYGIIDNTYGLFLGDKASALSPYLLFNGEYLKAKFNHLSMSNSNNVIFLSDNNTSRILINQTLGIENTSEDIVFAIGDKLIYDKNLDILSVNGNLLVDSTILGTGNIFKVGVDAISAGNNGFLLTGVNQNNDISFISLNTTTGDLNIKGNVLLDSHSLQYGVKLAIGDNAITLDDGTKNNGFYIYGENSLGNNSYLKLNTDTGDFDIKTFGNITIGTGGMVNIFSGSMYIDSNSTFSVNNAYNKILFNNDGTGKFLLNTESISTISDDISFQIGNSNSNNLSYDRITGDLKYSGNNITVKTPSDEVDESYVDTVESMPPNKADVSYDNNNQKYKMVITCTCINMVKDETVGFDVSILNRTYTPIYVGLYYEMSVKTKEIVFYVTDNSTDLNIRKTYSSITNSTSSLRIDSIKFYKIIKVSNGISFFDSTGLNTLSIKNGKASFMNLAIGRNSQDNVVSQPNQAWHRGSFANTSLGYNTLSSMVYGHGNTAIGAMALRVADSITTTLLNSQCTDNVAVGYLSLGSSMDSTQNTAIGSSSLSMARRTKNNVSIGYQSLSADINPDYSEIIEDNVSIGSSSMNLYNASSCYGNTSIGVNSFNFLGSSGMMIRDNINIVAGAHPSFSSGWSSKYISKNTILTPGDTPYIAKGAYTDNAYGLENCVFIGSNAGVLASVANGDRIVASVALGYNANVYQNYMIALGDTLHTTYVYGTVQNRSDERDKADIIETKHGLDFILKLRPVDYKWDMREDYITYDAIYNEEKNIMEEVRIQTPMKDIIRDGSKKRNRNHSGFIAQDVKKIIDETGIDFGGFQDHSVQNPDNQIMSLGYDEFAAPIVKSIQEIYTKHIVKMEENIKSLQDEIALLKNK